MPKAILELEMPESCGQCNLCVYAVHAACWHCAGLEGVRKCPREGKRADCPLKLVEDKEAQYE